MKKTTPKIQLIGENKKTKQAVLLVPMAILPDLEELFDQDTMDYQIALKRKNDPKRELVSLKQAKKELGL